MQKKLVNGHLLDSDGVLLQKGYATTPILKYKRRKIKAAKWRIKEWDYYLIHDDNYAVALTIADNSYIGALSVSVIDLKQGTYTTESKMIPFPMGRFKMPESSEEGDIEIQKGKYRFRFKRHKEKRELKVQYPNFKENLEFECNLQLTHEPEESMVIAIPFLEDKRAFYYNQKINCFTAQGKIKIGDWEYEFNPENSVGLLDWGRGVWTFKNTWYWSSASGLINHKKFGFNFGYGFGETDSATENVILYDNKIHKLRNVKFVIPQNGNDWDYMSIWKIISDDNRINLEFKPIVDRKDYVKVLFIKTDQHQVFGKFNGTCVLDNGEIITLKDFIGFAEKVENHW